MYQVALPEIEYRQRRRSVRDIRIWCAGCASGEEAYSFLILMMEYWGKEYKSWDAGLLATDISAPVLERARAGIYPDARLKLVPENLLIKYFKKLPNGDWQVSEKLKREIIFRRFNLSNKTLPFNRAFDIISCRNVMIYFSDQFRDEFVKRLYHFLVPG